MDRVGHNCKQNPHCLVMSVMVSGRVLLGLEVGDLGLVGKGEMGGGGMWMSWEKMWMFNGE